MPGRTEISVEAHGRSAETASSRSFWRRAAPGVGGISLVVLVYLAWSLFCFGSVRDGLLFVKGVRLAIEPETVPVGAGRPGEERRARFRVRNLSGKPITLHGATTSCTCLSVDPLPVTIPAGREKPLGLSLVLRGKPLQSFEQVVSYMTDLPEQPSVRVKVVGRLIE
jgi:hypothetical protein